MLDPFTLDQLRTLICVAEEGSFSAAARKLRRVQSAVSSSMSNLEQHLGVPVWDRSTKIPTLSEPGRQVLYAAQRVCAEVDGLHRLTQDMQQGLEPFVSLCVDQLLPVSALVDLCRDFATRFESVELRVDTQTLSAVAARVTQGAASIGVASSKAFGSGVDSQFLTAIRMVPVVSKNHPLAKAKGPIPTKTLREHVQIVLSERSDDGMADQGVLSPHTYRVADLHTKHAMLRAGLGWGNLPEHLIREDLKTGRLKPLRVRAWGEHEHTLHLSVIYRSGKALGPAHRWVIERLEHLCQRDVSHKSARRV